MQIIGILILFIFIELFVFLRIFFNSRVLYIYKDFQDKVCGFALPLIKGRSYSQVQYLQIETTSQVQYLQIKTMSQVQFLL